MGKSHKENFQEGIKFVFFQMPPALKSANACCFLIGESVSIFGSWITQITLIWMVYQLTNSAMLVGVAGFTNQVTGLIITPIVGVLLDRWNLRYVLLTTQIVSIFLSSTLIFLTVNGNITVFWIIIIGILQGTVRAFDLPARIVTIPRLVDNKTDTYSAVSVHSFLANTAKFVSPMIGGLLLTRSGAASCFLVDIISYIPFLSVILTCQIKSFANNYLYQKNQFFVKLNEGFIYINNFLPFKSVLLLQVLICFMAMSYINLMPIFAKNVLNGNAETMGLLMTASGLGSLVATFHLVFRKKVIGLEKMIAYSTGILGLSLILFSQSTNLHIAMVIIFIVGMNISLTLTAISNFIQLILVDEDKRGRVTSIFTTCFLGIIPFGNLFFGGLTAQIGVKNALLFGGLWCLIGAYYFIRKLSDIEKVLYPIYLEMGWISNKH